MIQKFFFFLPYLATQIKGPASLIEGKRLFESQFKKKNIRSKVERMKLFSAKVGRIERDEAYITVRWGNFS